MQEERKPKIRFDGYNDEWEEKAIGECFNERIENMPSGELLSVTINDGVKKFVELGRHDNSNEDKSKYKKVCVGDIAYNSMRMWQGASGYSPYEGIVSPAYTVLSPKEGINSKFFSYLFKRDDMLQVFQSNSQGITSDNWNLKFPALSKIKVFIPCQNKEQTQIADWLENIDNIIKSQQRKYTQLMNMKQTLLEKMFPHDGAKSPEIRLAGFKDDWKLERLGDYITECTDKTSDLSKYPLFSLTIEDGVTEKTERYERGFLVSKSGDLYKIVLPGCFVTNPMNLRFGAVGYNKKDDSVSVSGYYDVFSIDNNECSPFWNAYFKTEQMLKMFDDVATGSLLEKRRVHFSNLKDLKVIAPKEIAEKRGIGNIFLMVDNLISLQQLKLVQLKNIKQSFLDKMFVS